MTREERLILSTLYYPGSSAAAFFARLPPDFDLWRDPLPEKIKDTVSAKWDTACRHAASLEEECRNHGMEYLLPGDPLYPPALFELEEPPLALYVQGDVSVLSRPGVTIVGTRRATPHGLAMAEHIACLAVRAGYTVISGGAAGIDSAAHEGALACAEEPPGGATIAVVGGGLASALDSTRAWLLRRIRVRGLIMSEFPPQTGALPFHFVRRNRILVALASHLFVVQSPVKSGTMITADWAQTLKRGISVCLWPPRLLEGVGGMYIRGEGVEYTADGSGFLGQNIHYTPLAGLFAEIEECCGADRAARRVLHALLAGGLTPAGLVRASALAPEEAFAALTRMEMRGRVRNYKGRLYFVPKTA
jgi:DNA processing protein